jgi:hypothetical protein
LMATVLADPLICCSAGIVTSALSEGFSIG